MSVLMPASASHPQCFDSSGTVVCFSALNGIIHQGIIVRCEFIYRLSNIRVKLYKPVLPVADSRRVFRLDQSETAQQQTFAVYL